MTVTPVDIAASARLRRLYLARFAFAVIWAIALIAVTASPAPGAILTALLVLYPLVDAAAVLWQRRSVGRASSSAIAEWGNVAISVLAAIGLGVASSVSISAALSVWGIWAIVSGITQLVTAVLRRRVGGQVPLMISGALSVLAGLGFLIQGLGGGSGAAGIGGYAIFGGVLFLVSAIRLTLLIRKNS